MLSSFQINFQMLSSPPPMVLKIRMADLDMQTTWQTEGSPSVL